MASKLLAVAIVGAGASSGARAAEPEPAVHHRATIFNHGKFFNGTCDRACLLDALSSYTNALVTHDPVSLHVTGDVRYTENGKTLRLGEGLWKTAASFSYRQSIVEAAAGQAAFYGVVQETDGQSGIFVLRLKMLGRDIAEIETLIARKGAHPIYGPENLTTPKSVWNDAVSEAERSTREQLIAAANGYFDGIEHHNGLEIAFHPDCNRTENGIQTTNNPPRFPLNCPDSIKGLTYINRVRDRRFPIVDVERGLVFAVVSFDIPGTSTAPPPTSDGQINAQLLQARSLMLFELFKVESGRIREIEAFMSNTAPGASNGW